MFMRLDENDNKFRRSRLKRIVFRNYDAVIISDYNKGFITEKDIEYIASKHENTFLDTKKILGEWCGNIKFIKINNYEYEKTKHRISPEIKEKLIITMGPDGCKHNDTDYPVPKVEIKDSSGAGDTFIAALTVKFVETSDISESIIYANKCATEVVQKRGVSTI